MTDKLLLGAAELLPILFMTNGVMNQTKTNDQDSYLSTLSSQGLLGVTRKYLQQRPNISKPKTTSPEEERPVYPINPPPDQPPEEEKKEEEEKLAEEEKEEAIHLYPSDGEEELLLEADVDQGVGNDDNDPERQEFQQQVDMYDPPLIRLAANLSDLPYSSIATILNILHAVTQRIGYAFRKSKNDGEFRLIPDHMTDEEMKQVIKHDKNAKPIGKDCRRFIMFDKNDQLREIEVCKEHGITVK